MNEIQKCGFTVVVITYNPIWEKLKMTLDSILLQTYEDYEIVIADDGSKDSLANQTEAYLKQKGFTRYTYVLNEKNQGTIKNLISGIEIAKGKYIKAIGPGDLFYAKDSLKKMFDFMESKGCDAAFGLMHGYHMDDNHHVMIHPYTFPFDIEAYRKEDEKRIAKNLILFADNVSGAAMFYGKDFILSYFREIAKQVIYLEDVFQVMAAVDGNYLQFYDDYMIWYESDTGVSTGGNSGFRKLLMKDRTNFFAMLQDKYPEHPLVNKRKKLDRAYRIDNPYCRVIAMAFVTPSVLLWTMRHYLQVFTKKYDGKRQDGFLVQQNFFR